MPHPRERDSPVEQAIMRTQDLKYVEMKLATEKKVGGMQEGREGEKYCKYLLLKKVERLQASLHLLGNSAAESGRTHTFFVDSPDQGESAVSISSQITPGVCIYYVY